MMFNFDVDKLYLLYMKYVKNYSMHHCFQHHVMLTEIILNFRCYCKVTCLDANCSIRIRNTHAISAVSSGTGDYMYGYKMTVKSLSLVDSEITHLINRRH